MENIFLNVYMCITESLCCISRDRSTRQIAQLYKSITHQKKKVSSFLKFYNFNPQFLGKYSSIFLFSFTKTVYVVQLFLRQWSYEVGTKSNMPPLGQTIFRLWTELCNVIFKDLSLIYQSTKLNSWNRFQNKFFCSQQNEAITWISFSTWPIFLPMVINQSHWLHFPFYIHFQALLQVAKHFALRK